MIHIVEVLPATVITRLPARWARQCASNSSAILFAKKRRPTDQQLLVDVSVIHQSDARTGIQRVVRALLLQLLQNPPIGYRICPIFATRQHGYRYASHNFLERMGGQDSDTMIKPVEVEQGDIFLALDLAAHLLPLHQAQILRWKRDGVQIHVLVYDLLPLLHPKWFNSKTTRNFKRWIRWLTIYADNAICISQTVKAELHAWLSARFNITPTVLPSNTITLGADIAASAPSNGLPTGAKNWLSHLSSVSTILMVGTLEPRKGHDQVLAAFEHLWQQSETAPSLVLVGRAGWKTEVLQKKLRNHPEADRRLFWPDNVSDELLAQLYAVCNGVLVASRAEGFGLPLIEAALYNRPVLARDLPVFHEIGLPGITFFSGEDASSLSRAIVNWIGKEVNISSPIQNVTTWQMAGQQLLDSLGLRDRISDSKILAEEVQV